MEEGEGKERGLRDGWGLGKGGLGGVEWSGVEMREGMETGNAELKRRMKKEWKWG